MTVTGQGHGLRCLNKPETRRPQPAMLWAAGQAGQLTIKERSADWDDLASWRSAARKHARYSRSGGAVQLEAPFCCMKKLQYEQQRKKTSQSEAVAKTLTKAISASAV